MNGRICKKCGVEKSANEFKKCKKYAGGIFSWCKLCCKEYKHDYYLRNKEKIKKQSELYTEKNKKLQYQRSRNWLKRNSNRMKEWKKQWRKKYYSDPKNRIDKSIQGGIYKSLRGKKAGRTWESLVGYTAEDLIKRLENQFKDGMSWNNYGEWQIDHIKPQSWFKYESETDQQFKECWSLDNLQPLWAKDNQSKNNRFVG